MRKTRPNELDPGSVAVRARNVTFNWADTPMHWIRKDPSASQILNAIHLLLPEGERMFCATFTEALPLVKDEQLREQILGFIGQEIMHAETHDKVVWEVLEAHGIDPHPFLRQAEYLFRKSLGPREARSVRAAHQQLAERIALIATLEHFFAFFGDWILNADLERFDADPRMLDLFRWHGAEEVEHRFVAHDVAEYFGISYLRRVTLMVAVYSVFFLLMFRGAKFLVHQDQSLPNYGYPRLIGKLLVGTVRGTLPSVPKLIHAAVSVLNPWYTPASVGNTAQAVAYLARSEGARAAAS